MLLTDAVLRCKQALPHLCTPLAVVAGCVYHIPAVVHSQDNAGGNTLICGFGVVPQVGACAQGAEGEPGVSPDCLTCSAKTKARFRGCHTTCTPSKDA